MSPEINRLRPASGVAAWNDFSPVAQAARQALADAAGINVPHRSFIVWVVAGYLLVLVPVNWAFFRLLGRVEWAWAAAPLIALGGTVLVLHLAQINIGFARSQNEIAVVELQGDYPRAHLTRYTALYTSLATRYEFQSDDPGAQILPFPKVARPEQFQMLTWQSPSRLLCQRGENVRVSGFAVNSNALDFIHSEELLDVGGPLSLARTTEGQFQVNNGTRLALSDVHVLRKDLNGELETAAVGALESGVSATLDFQPSALPETPSKPEDENPSASPSAPSGELSLQGLIKLARNAVEMRPGQVRLVGTVTDGIPPSKIEPESRQLRRASLLVANLDDGRSEPPQPDETSRSQMEQILEKHWSE